MAEDKIIKMYIEFKEACIHLGVYDIDEIIKLFEVWLNRL